MNQSNKESKYLSIFIIISILFGIASSVPTLEGSKYLKELSVISNQVYFASFFQLCMTMAYIGIIVIIYPLFRKYNEKLALTYYTLRTISVSLLLLSIVCLLYLVEMSNVYVSTIQASLMTIEISAELMRIARDWINHILVIFTWTAGGLLMYIFFFKSKIVPRWISISGLVGCFSTLIVTVALLFNQVEVVSSLYILMNMPLAITEIVLAIYLSKNGFSYI